MLLLANLSMLTYAAVGIAGASPQAHIYVDPKGIIADIGDSFTIDIKIQDVLDLFQYSGRLRFNKNILEATSIEEGPFLKEGTTSPSGTFFQASVDSIGVHVNCVTIGSYPGVDGARAHNKTAWVSV